MLWLPVESVLIVKVAVVTPPVVLTVPVPRVVLPSLKVTVPVGLAAAFEPGLVMLTVAVKVTAWPETDGLTDELTVVVVLAWFTV